MADCMHNSGLIRKGDYLVCKVCGAKLYNPSPDARTSDPNPTGKNPMSRFTATIITFTAVAALMACVPTLDIPLWKAAAASTCLLLALVVFPFKKATPTGDGNR